LCNFLKPRTLDDRSCVRTVVVNVSPGSAETLVRRGGITHQRLMAYSVSNISAQNNENWLIYVDVIVSFFETRRSLTNRRLTQSLYSFICRHVFTIVSYLIGVFVFATIVGEYFYSTPALQALYMLQKIYLSVRPSVRHNPVLCPNEETQRDAVFTNG